MNYSLFQFDFKYNFNSYFRYICDTLNGLNGFYSRSLQRSWLNMFLPAYVLLSVLHQCLCVDITYYVEEGKSPNTLIGDIAADSHLMDSVSTQDRDLIRFSQLGESIQLFRVEKKSGKLYTSQTLDAESLCVNNKECFQIIKVAVRRAKTFMKILKVKVIVQDVNDHQPEFPEKQVNIQFYEDVGTGQRYPYLTQLTKMSGSLTLKSLISLKKV